MSTLKDAKVGQTVSVTKIQGEGAVKRRIMDILGDHERYREFISVR